MSINSTIRAALKPVAPIEADAYEGSKETYITMGYVSVPTDYGDDDPAHEVFMISVHLFAPLGKDTVKMRQEIKRRLHEAGTTWPTCTNASDKEGQHHVFECEIAQEVGAE